MFPHVSVIAATAILVALLVGNLSGDICLVLERIKCIRSCAKFMARSLIIVITRSLVFEKEEKIYVPTM